MPGLPCHGRYGVACPLRKALHKTVGENEMRVTRYLLDFALVAAAGAILLTQPTFAQQQQYPDRPVRVLVGQSPGGGTDSVARVITQKLADTLGQSFVVDNRPSAGGNVAGELAARAAPDGYTLIIVTPTHVINPSLYRNVLYDAITDFAGVCQIVDAQYYLSVANNVPATTVKELIAVAKSRTTRLTYASSGLGSALERSSGSWSSSSCMVPRCLRQVLITMRRAQPENEPRPVHCESER